MAKRDFLAVTDLSRDQIVPLFDLAHRMKTGAYRETPLARKSLAMISAKSSTRTRVSFEAAPDQVGRQALWLSCRDIHRGRGEPVPDAGPSLSRTVRGDVGASMEEEEEGEARRNAFRGYTVDPDLMKLADRQAIFLHCLPAHRGEEVAAQVIEGPQSRVWDEAENRLHVQKALLATLLG